MTMSVAHEEKRQGEADRDERDTGIERIGPQSLIGSDRTSQERRAGKGAVTSDLVQAHRKPATLGPDQMTIHDHGRRPREALTYTQKCVRDKNPTPRRCPHEKEGNRHR